MIENLPQITDNGRTLVDIRSMDMEELTAFLTEQGYPKFRAKQMFEWMHEKRCRDFSEMSNLPAAMRSFLEENCSPVSLKLLDRQISKLDGTQKFLFGLPSGNEQDLVESVFMPYRYGNSVCISSQVGCRMGCSFCASTLDGLIRNLAPSEMLEQIYEIERTTGEKISHVVVMGTGEPLDNYDNLVRFLRLLTMPGGMNLSQRNITVSTCGIVPGIRRLAEEDLSVTLALSLHAANDEKRKKIMPVAKRFSISELMEACEYYFDRTGRRITFEYSLIRGVNDSEQDAKELSALAGRVHAHINLIPVNPVAETGYTQPAEQAVEAFKNRLEKQRINVSIRRVMGRDIDGACGQLRHRKISED